MDSPARVTRIPARDLASFNVADIFYATGLKVRSQATGKRKKRGENLPDVSLIGLGYIGLPTAATIVRAGTRVHGVDVSTEVIDQPR